MSAVKRKKRAVPGWLVRGGQWLLLAGLAVLLARLIAGYLLEAARLERSPAAEWGVFILGLLLVVLTVALVRRASVLWSERRRQVSGALIRVRLALFFVAASLLPVVLSSLVLFAVADSGLDMLYRPEIENALEISVGFVREGRDAICDDFRKFCRREFGRQAGHFERRDIRNGIFVVERLGRCNLASPDVPDVVRRVVQSGQEEATLVSEREKDRILLIYLNTQPTGTEYGIMELHPAFDIGAEAIGSALAEYRQMRLVREPLGAALVYFAVIFIILMVLTSLLLAMRFARIVTEPLRELVEGTRRIARGELDYRVANVGRDEFAQLVDNFNNMSGELRQSRQRLYHAERLAAWQEVARRLAHEIKNPLTPIQLGAERILRQSRRGSENLAQIIEKALPAIIGEVKVIENLVDEFASFSRMPGKRIELVGLLSFVEETVTPLRSAHEDIAFELDLQADAGEALFDREQMRRAIGNLLQNSVNAIGKSERPGRIGLSLKRFGDSVMFVISDNGCGIPDEVGTQVFAPYYSATDGGSGLGLSIVEKIVYDHDGKIWFESSPSGTVFYVSIPGGGLQGLEET